MKALNLSDKHKKNKPSSIKQQPTAARRRETEKPQKESIQKIRK
jgi:hypothetical protein